MDLEIHLQGVHFWAFILGFYLAHQRGQWEVQNIRWEPERDVLGPHSLNHCFPSRYFNPGLTTELVRESLENRDARAHPQILCLRLSSLLAFIGLTIVSFLTVVEETYNQQPLDRITIHWQSRVDFQPIQPCKASYLRVKWSATEPLVRETRKVAVSPSRMRFSGTERTTFSSKFSRDHRRSSWVG